ncbi:MAG: hypothetical protein HRF45_07060 [Fimbriimonadia bacterium]|jgi:hypothetical protein
MRRTSLWRGAALVAALGAVGWIAVTGAVPCGPGESWIRYWRPITACYDWPGHYCNPISWNYGYAWGCWLYCCYDPYTGALLGKHMADCYPDPCVLNGGCCNFTISCEEARANDLQNFVCPVWVP